MPQHPTMKTKRSKPLRGAEEVLHIGTHGLEWSEQGERLSEFIMSPKNIHGNSQFQKPPSLRWTWKSPDGQFHNEIDHIIFNRKYWLTDVSGNSRAYTPAWSSTSVRQLSTDARACEAMQSGDKGRSQGEKGGSVG
ncbi:unnamed protein product [Heligmosomoides polygyrus]|uniref:Uncharacterized protein n=1 Tax=Heligmosomoides polygyrus TaxID=6339 RepID=A0A183FK18_HELPZ|nr:unnamed protein product [Heligmosomoides polygyrus]